MTIAVFGATGGTGFHFVRFAIEEGLQIKALVRDPTKDSISQVADKIEVIKGDLYKYEDVEKTVKGCDVVVGLVGAEQKDIMVTFKDNVLKAMRENNIKRLIVMTTAAVKTSEDNFSLGQGFMSFFLKNI
ncbi:SDR family oxidoreductase [Acrasis kona]|uniref:SDR family oxidoreductase n=1 Tax=Acrasis kona TaxID=1008807 RepID=A0AAW2Z5R6_9EUKA